MSNQDAGRLETELDLLDAMYPDQLHYDFPSRELKFTQGLSSLHLRLPESYPDAGLPDVISATDPSKTDLRVQIKDAIKGLGLTGGEEALDAFLAAFQQVLETTSTGQQDDESSTSSLVRQTHGATLGQSVHQKPKTVIIWLHHLLNTNKRKLALSPPPSSPPVSGITKPGYPGVLIYSGPSSTVTEHVNTLKAQNWQAFQVRYEEEELWTLTHGEGVKEVESMSHVVKAVQGIATQKEEFLKAVGIK
ncbi:hypothetical protein IAQ61_008403 [Plenodomus lingam]|uniref:RWD domain-containing protein n=1 Tax=Leptosphaeria maculans (strain JN3 / isolate v23.1.3 / race Av1-4-5-6-7-8) TaxID=985895 RepID=E4ZU81_LEPMJ|nr:hypothetical protein LEMA_P113750.1 [Plenodomus lingam JN3]KAH9866398.1 hypothetical protein IAQ61_008403 [Plenodomus lingam]CBX94960.1 hypothetical protein LEMA_P113750.1 [Plenodomus lingam JN3]